MTIVKHVPLLKRQKGVEKRGLKSLTRACVQLLDAKTGLASQANARPAGKEKSNAVVHEEKGGNFMNVISRSAARTGRRDQNTAPIITNYQLANREFELSSDIRCVFSSRRVSGYMFTKRKTQILTSEHQYTHHLPSTTPPMHVSNEAALSLESKDSGTTAQVRSGI